ncbi:MAG: HNH endonuclease [Bacilli bacterium]|nr:HNH endonuclease [Bacilli bacterium]
MTKELTKEMLNEMGIKIEWKDEDWVVTRFAKGPGKNSQKSWRTIKRGVVIGKHKYANDKIYPSYAWSYNNKPFIVTESRLIYAYFIGNIPENYDIDHIDNNPMNNQLNNLRLLTREENLRKRFLDNEYNCKNQYDYIKRHKGE